MELVSEQEVTGTKVTDIRLPEDPRGESTGTHATARNAIAQAVAAVLPNVQSPVTAWLARSGVTPGEDRDFSNLTFEGLGGTSLLAVEAAWRASNQAVRVGAGPATEPIPPSCQLTAQDFLRGTLEEAAVILDGVLQTASLGSVRTKTVSREAATGSTVGIAATDESLDDCPAAVAGPISAAPLVLSTPATAFPLSSPRRRKRRYDELGNNKELTRSRPFFAVGRAGAGFRHTPACLGEVDDTCTRKSRGEDKPRVELEVRWSSCLSKCIDATPLVVLPKPTMSAVGCVRKGCTDETSGVTDEASIQVTAPECLCGADFPSDAVGSKARKMHEGRSPDCGSPPASSTPYQQGSVYIGSHSGEFQSLNLFTGELEWSFTARGRIESGAACSLDGRNVFIGCHDGRLYAIDRRSGTLSWSFETGDAIKCTPVCMHSGLSDVSMTEKVLQEDEGTVLVGSHDGILRSLGETDGQIRWSFDCSGALFASVAHDSAARVVYAATTKGRVVALDHLALVLVSVEAAGSADDTASNHRLRGVSPKQPTIVWDIHLPAPCFSTPAVCDTSGNVVLGCVDGGLYCLSSAGEQMWVCHREKPVFSSPCLLPCLPKEPGDFKDHSGTQIVWGCHDG